MSNDFMKPLLLYFTFSSLYLCQEKNFGQHVAKDISETKQILHAVMISVVVGFYDGSLALAGSF
jgi:hypothetical protein